jgi:hypothetical protein
MSIVYPAKVIMDGWVLFDEFLDLDYYMSINRLAWTKHRSYNRSTVTSAQ